MLDDERLRSLAGQLVAVPGVVAVLLGGSRARGEQGPDSDVDLGLYYRPPLDPDALGALARAVAGPQANVTDPGGWGPWVDGGGWFTIDGTAVDWLYRDVDRVRRAWVDAVEGRFRWNTQVGHPLGVPDFAYAGEVALGAVLADPTGELTALQAETRDYPESLGRQLVGGLGEAQFLLGIAAKVAARGDAAYVAGCLFRAFLLCAHALHGDAGRWLINEKGAITAAGRLPGAPAAFAARAHGVLGAVGTTAAELRAVLAAAEELVHEVLVACRRG